VQRAGERRNRLLFVREPARRRRIPALVASALVVSGFSFAGVASAAGGAGSRPADAVADAQREADAASNRYFKALSSYQSLDSTIASIEHQLTVAQARRDKLRREARLRAADVYRNAGTALGDLDADTALDAARRQAMFDSVSAHDLTVFSQLHRASDDLQAQREQLKAQKRDQARQLDGLKAQDRALETKLRAAVTQREADAARQRQQAALVAAQAQAAAKPSAPAATPAGAAAVPKPPPGSGPPPPPVPYTPTPGMNPHHDEPFLVCTRARESGGRYGAVNPGGPFYGAYQFLQGTWDVASAHAGRPELIGVEPSRASAYDQDDVAWSLYQSQGNAPWNGLC
jgi:Transglycosylase-like domain